MTPCPGLRSGVDKIVVKITIFEECLSPLLRLLLCPT
jgi:hypothetical protein